MRIIADENIPFVKDCFETIGDVVTLPGRAINREIVKNADCLLVRSITKVNEELLAGSGVKFVATATIGIEHIDIDYLNKNQIGFASAPGSNANSVAEYVVAGLLSVGNKKKITLAGESIAVIGVGNVGSRVVNKCTALGMKCVLNDPPLQRQTNDEKYRPIEEVFGCDIVTVHTPLTRAGTDKTYHLADDGFFSRLKDGCIFINSSRGGCVDTAALKKAITCGKLKAAIIDVWENEPKIDLELLRMVDISTPHIAGYSYDGKIAGMVMIYEAACRHFGLKPQKDAKDFLPVPAVPEIIIDETSGDEQKVLHETVRQVYVINRDDFNTREISMVPASERGGFFDGLRKAYPVRREFQNTKVILKGCNANLAKKLGGIGFEVCDAG